MAKLKKDARYLNAYIHTDVFDEFSQFCDSIGQSKSVATERAICAYMQNISSVTDIAAEYQKEHRVSESVKHDS